MSPPGIFTFHIEHKIAQCISALKADVGAQRTVCRFYFVYSLFIKKRHAIPEKQLYKFSHVFRIRPQCTLWSAEQCNGGHLNCLPIPIYILFHIHLKLTS